MRSRLLIVIAFISSFAGAAEEKLNVRTGSWEIMTTTQVSGVLTLDDKTAATLTATQIDDIEAAFKDEAANGPQTEVSRECVTEDDAVQPFGVVRDEHCTQTIMRTLSATQEVSFACSGETQSTGVLRIATPTPETMTGALRLRSANGADPLTIDIKMRGRWLAVECEDEDVYEGDDADEEGEDAEYDEPEEEAER